MIIKPARPGIKLRDPKTLRHVPSEGIRVPDASPDAHHWHRQARAGDAVIEPDPAPAPAPKEG